MKKIISKPFEPSEQGKQSEAKQLSKVGARQLLIERFPNERDRKEYIRGGRNGGVAAKHGSQKSADFVKQPLAYQMGYDERFAEVQAEHSPEVIAANRANAKRRVDQHYHQKKLMEKRRKEEACANVEFPRESNPKNTHPLIPIAPQPSSAVHPGQTVQELNKGYIEQPPSMFFNNRGGVFNPVVNEGTNSVEINPEERADLLELLNEFERPKTPFVTELEEEKNGIELDSCNNLAKLLILLKEFETPVPSPGADAPTLTPFATTESLSAYSQRSPLTRGLEGILELHAAQKQHLFFSSESQGPTEGEKQKIDSMEFTKS